MNLLILLYQCWCLRRLRRHWLLLTVTRSGHAWLECDYYYLKFEVRKLGITNGDQILQPQRQSLSRSDPLR